MSFCLCWVKQINQLNLQTDSNYGFSFQTIFLLEVKRTWHQYFEGKKTNIEQMLSMVKFSFLFFHQCYPATIYDWVWINILSSLMLVRPEAKYWTESKVHEWRECLRYSSFAVFVSICLDCGLARLAHQCQFGRS